MKFELTTINQIGCLEMEKNLFDAPNTKIFLKIRKDIILNVPFSAEIGFHK